MHVQGLGLKAGKAAGDGLELLAHSLQVVQTFPQAEILQIIRQQFVAQKTRELLVLTEQGIFEVHAEDVVTMFDLFDHGGEFPADLLGQPHAEDLADLLKR